MDLLSLRARINADDKATGVLESVESQARKAGVGGMMPGYGRRTTKRQ
jgi:hypothetical protein